MSAPFCPPSPSDADRASFAELRKRLPAIWQEIHSRPHTSVVVPSLSFDSKELAKIQGEPFYEERLLFTLMRLRHPGGRVIYVTSQPIHPDIVDYYLQLLLVPASHARRRLQMLCVYDASARSLTEKILERPRVLQRIREGIGDPTWSYLSCFNSTERELSLAVALGIPLNAVDPDLLWLGTKSGSRRLFREAEIPLPLGREHLGAEEEVVDALLSLVEQRPKLQRAVLKLDESFAGEGNALFSFPQPLPRSDAARRQSVRESLDRFSFSSEHENAEAFLQKLFEKGGIVEEMVEAREIHSPSVQLRITPTGEVELVSTHEQILGGPVGQSYVGCRFPARNAYRSQLQQMGLSVGRVLRDRGVISRFSVDFVAARDAEEEWRLLALEINLRLGGTTHPFLALEFLTGGRLDPTSGLFLSPRGGHKYYFSTDQLKSQSYRGLLPEDLLEILTGHRLHFDPRTETGVLFHMIGALSQYGKLGITCIGDSPEQVDELYADVVSILDKESGAQKVGSTHLSVLFDRISL